MVNAATIASPYLFAVEEVSAGGTVAGYEGYLWNGQLHNHAGEYGDDGTGTVAVNLDYAKNTASPKLEFAGLTPHSHMQTNAQWTSYTSAVNAKIISGTFVAIPGAEWGTLSTTNHVNVFYGSSRASSATGDIPAFYNWLASSSGYGSFNHPWDSGGNDMSNWQYYSIADKPGNNAGKMVMMEFKQTLGSSTGFDDYPEALNNGWHIGITVSDDEHSGKPGDKYTNNPRTGMWLTSLSTSAIQTAMQELRFFASQTDTGYIDIKVGSFEMGDIATGLGASETVSAKLNPSLSYSEVKLFYKSGTTYTSKSMTSAGSGVYTVTQACNIDSWFFVRAKTSSSAYIVSSPIWTSASGGDTTAPTVSISSPTNGATVSGTTTISASASDNVGVSKVEFYIDSTLKITDTSSPYSYSWDTTTYSNAGHSIYTKAYDAVNNVGTSTTISVTVSNTVSDTTAPTVSVTAPSSGATVSGTTTISASASDNVGVSKVEFYIDSTLKITDTSSPYSYSWDTTAYSNAGHSIYAKAYDAANNVGTSTTISVTVSNTVSDDGGALSNGVTANGNMDSTDGADMWYIDVGASATSMYVVMACGSSDFDTYGKFNAQPTTSSYDWRGYTDGGEENTVTSPSQGRHYIMVDYYSGSGTYTLIATITYGSSDTTAPTVSISSPSNGATVSGSVTISFSASDNSGTISSRAIKIDGVSKSTSSSYTWDTTSAANGAHTIRCEATDPSGNVGYSQITVTVSNTVQGPPYTFTGVAGADQYYDVYLTAGRTVQISLSWSGSTDLDWFLYYGTSTSYIVRGYTVNNPEVGTWTVDTTGWYKIKINKYSGSDVTFTLNVTYI
jgi:hypothetical protein